MKGLTMSVLSGLILASIGISYADAIRVTVINDAASLVNERLLITPSATVNQQPKQYNLPAMIKMFTADYNYPGPIQISSSGSLVTCNWVSPPIGKQVIKNLTLNISNDATTKKPNCVIDWQ